MGKISCPIEQEIRTNAYIMAAMVYPNDRVKVDALAEKAEVEAKASNSKEGLIIFTQISDEFQKASKDGQRTSYVFRQACGVYIEGDVIRKASINESIAMAAKYFKCSKGTIKNAWRKYKNSAHLWAGFFSTCEAHGVLGLSQLNAAGLSVLEQLFHSQNYLNLARDLGVNISNWAPFEIEVPEEDWDKFLTPDEEFIAILKANPSAKLKVFNPTLSASQVNFISNSYETEPRTRLQKHKRRIKRTLHGIG